MAGVSDQKHDTALSDIARNVARCRRALEQLSDTCCLAERSAHMGTLMAELEMLDQMADQIFESGADTAAADDAIGQVGAVGGALGTLYATCCTPTREKLYILMFKALGDIHTGFWRVKGVSH